MQVCTKQKLRCQLMTRNKFRQAFLFIGRHAAAIDNHRFFRFVVKHIRVFGKQIEFKTLDFNHNGIYTIFFVSKKGSL